MRRLVRRPLHDELLSSAWARTARRAGLPIGVVTKAITGRKWYPTFFQGGHLDVLAQCIGSTSDALLFRHTTFPYSTAFYSDELAKVARATALLTGPRARASGPITQSTSDLVPRRRWCSTCALRDLDAWGESYWRRSHNLPGVLVCLHHDEPLRESQHATTGPGTWTTDLPHECGRGRALARSSTRFLRGVAQQSVQLLEQRPPVSASWYRSRLQEVGLLSAGRDVSGGQLVEWARTVGGRDLAVLGFTRRESLLTWLPLMVRPGVREPFIPLKHVVLRTALMLAGPPKGELDHKPTGPGARAHLRDEEHASALRALTKHHEESGGTVRVSDALAEIGCWGSYRHNRQRFPRLEREVHRLRRSRVSVRRVRSE